MKEQTVLKEKAICQLASLSTFLSGKTYDVDNQNVREEKTSYTAEEVNDILEQVINRVDFVVESLDLSLDDDREYRHLCSVYMK